jgi:hypothetical protein
LDSVREQWGQLPPAIQAIIAALVQEATKRPR